MQTDTIEVASPTSGVFRDYIASLCDWSISTSGLIKSASQQYDLFELWRNRSKLRVNYYDTEMRMVRSGYAIITNLRESAPNRSIPTYSISLQGCGELKKVSYADLMIKSQEVIATDVHISFTNDGNAESVLRNNHFFEYQQAGQIYSRALLWPSHLTRLKLLYGSRVAEYQPLVIIIRCTSSDWSDVKNTIQSLDTLKFIKKYEVAHIGGRWLSANNVLSKELLLTPGYIYRVITDSDFALSYIEAKVLELPTN